MLTPKADRLFSALVWAIILLAVLWLALIAIPPNSLTGAANTRTPGQGSSGTCRA